MRLHKRQIKLPLILLWCWTVPRFVCTLLSFNQYVPSKLNFVYHPVDFIAQGCLNFYPSCFFISLTPIYVHTTLTITLYISAVLCLEALFIVIKRSLEFSTELHKETNQTWWGGLLVIWYFLNEYLKYYWYPALMDQTYTVKPTWKYSRDRKKPRLLFIIT